MRKSHRLFPSLFLGHWGERGERGRRAEEIREGRHIKKALRGKRFWEVFDGILQHQGLCDTGASEQAIRNINLRVSQQTQDIDTMLVQCWTSVVDAGSTLVQQWVNVSRLLGSHARARYSPNDGSMLCKCRQHWSNIGWLFRVCWVWPLPPSHYFFSRDMVFTLIIFLMPS